MSTWSRSSGGSTRPTRARSSPIGTSCSTAATISPPATPFPTPASTKRKPLVTAAIGEYDGSLTTLKPYENGPDGKPNPTYRCLFPEAPPPGTVPTCSQVGVLGALAGALGSLMALEAIREIVGGFGDDDRGLVGRLLMIDTRSMRFETLTYGWDETNPLNGAQAAALGQFPLSKFGCFPLTMARARRGARRESRVH